jgi:hypothetical protein
MLGFEAGDLELRMYNPCCWLFPAEVSMPRRDGFWAFSIFGVVVLADVAARFWRLRAGLDILDRLTLGTIAMGIVVVWLAYRRNLRQIGGLKGQIEEGALERLARNDQAIGFFAYLMLIQALSFIHRH